MSKTKTSALERVKRIVAGKISSLEAETAEYARQMTEDYVDFFQNKSERAYKTTYKLQELRRTADRLNEKYDIEVYNYLWARAEITTSQLLNEPLQRHSTNGMANLAFALEAECKQELRNIYIRLAEILAESMQID